MGKYYTSIVSFIAKGMDRSLGTGIRLFRLAGWLLLPAFFAGAMSGLSMLVASGELGGPEKYGVIGGPEEQFPIFDNLSEAAALNQPTLDGGEDSIPYEGAGAVFVVVGGDSVLNAGNPLFHALPSREGILSYTVRDGDTLSRIGARFGISLQTIYWSNTLSSSVISPGQKLIILPINGVRHEVAAGDTVTSIAAHYGVDPQTIIDFNNITGALQPGRVLVVPNGKLSIPRGATSEALYLPSYPNYYVLPTTGWNWGRLHSYNAVDIANTCGTSVYAAAGGLVIETAQSGWNAGYGRFVRIEHPNGTKTLYAHLGSVAVDMGDLVERGEEIGAIGNSGKTHGPTGCHLHFEVGGAKNPFAR